MSWMLWLWPLVFIAAVLGTWLLRQVALNRQFLDIPVARSAHDTPTPVGGGLVIVVLFTALITYFYFLQLFESALYFALLGAVMVAIVGLLDDLYQLHVLWRMPLHLAAAVWSVVWLGELAPVAVLDFQITQQWLLKLLAVLSLVWLLNLYNFMDGIDGIAASEMLFVNVVSLLFVINNEVGTAGLLNLTLTASAAGFLIWNWPPAKIFMGDVGSGFCGFSLGLLAILTMQSGVMTVWTWLILLGVFVTDATLTLLRRVLQGERWYDGHSSHAYQHAARHYKSHAKVTITMLLINCLWLAPIAYLSVLRQELGFFLSLLALIPLSIVAIRFGAGKTDKIIDASEG